MRVGMTLDRKETATAKARGPNRGQRSMTIGMSPERIVDPSMTLGHRNRSENGAENRGAHAPKRGHHATHRDSHHRYRNSCGQEGVQTGMTLVEVNEQAATNLLTMPVSLPRLSLALGCILPKSASNNRADRHIPHGVAPRAHGRGTRWCV